MKITFFLRPKLKKVSRQIAIIFQFALKIVKFCRAVLDLYEFKSPENADSSAPPRAPPTKIKKCVPTDLKK